MNNNTEERGGEEQKTFKLRTTKGFKDSSFFFVFFLFWQCKRKWWSAVDNLTDKWSNPEACRRSFSKDHDFLPNRPTANGQPFWKNQENEEFTTPEIICRDSGTTIHVLTTTISTLPRERLIVPLKTYPFSFYFDFTSPLSLSSMLLVPLYLLFSLHPPIFLNIFHFIFDFFFLSAFCAFLSLFIFINFIFSYAMISRCLLSPPLIYYFL